MLFFALCFLASKVFGFLELLVAIVVETYYIHEKLKKLFVINRLKDMIVNLISWNHQQINEGIMSSPYPLFVIVIHT
jgi:hypothetical protein